MIQHFPAKESAKKSPLVTKFSALLSKSVIPSNESSKPVADQPLDLEIRTSFP